MVPQQKSAEEWFKQSAYDFDTAEAMIATGRYIYSVFMCHLSIEKQLKGLYTLKFEQPPGKIHDLVFFVEELSLDLPSHLGVFIEDLNALSVPTRYPDELDKIVETYTKARCEEIKRLTGELRKWLQETS